MTMVKNIVVSYPECTESTPSDSEATPQLRGSSEFFFASGDLVPFACARVDAPLGEWVPDSEDAVVPSLLSQTCLSCPGRLQCLLWAVASGSQGYWAGTTTTDRETMVRDGVVSVEVGQELQAQARRQAMLLVAADRNQALHPPGEGNLTWYRSHGCKCSECRSANATKRADERAKARAA